MTKLLIIDTSTQTLGLALCIGEQTHIIEDEGGAKTSDILMPHIAELLAQHGLAIKDLDAIAFSAGPGAFTGLRAAAATTQGLAFGAGLPVIPIITLQAGTQEYITKNNITEQSDILVQLDARMDEWYWAHYQWSNGSWHTLAPPSLSSPDVLDAYQQQTKPAHTITLLGTQINGMVTLAKQAWLEGKTVTAQEALPLYLRDKVALTTVERMALHANK